MVEAFLFWLNMDIWQFISTLELLSQPTEDFWLLYLDSDEYESYEKYRKIRRSLSYGLFDEAKANVDAFDKIFCACHNSTFSMKLSLKLNYIAKI